MTTGMEVGGWSGSGVFGVGGGLGLNVKEAPFGAKGDGVTDDTAAIQAALDFGAGSPVLVYLPAGTYNVMPAQQPSPTDESKGHALYLNYPNVSIAGDGQKATTIRAFVRGGLDPVAHWDVVPTTGAVWRGATFRVTPGCSGGVAIRDLRITGQTPRSSSPNYSALVPVPFPPSPVNGDGWGGGHSAFWFQPGMSCDGFRVSDCEIDSYRAEIFISQGATYIQKNFRFDRCYVHDGLANGINCAANQVIADCEITQCTQAIELYHYQANIVIERNNIHDNYKSLAFGGNVAISPATYGLLLVRHNRIGYHPGGVNVLGFVSRVAFLDNEFVDSSVLCGTLYGASPSDVVFERNRFVVDQHSLTTGLEIASDVGIPTYRIRIRNNIFMRSEYARAQGLDFSVMPLFLQVYNAADDVSAEGNNCLDTTGGGDGYESLGGINIPIIGNGGTLLWRALDTADSVAPTMPFYGQAYLKLVPTGAQTYSDWSGAPEREIFTVDVNANVTIAASATVKLDGGVSFAPGGTGGVITFVRPTGSTAIYEVSRFAY